VDLTGGATTVETKRESNEAAILKDLRTKRNGHDDALVSRWLKIIRAGQIRAGHRRGPGCRRWTGRHGWSDDHRTGWRRVV